MGAYHTFRPGIVDELCVHVPLLLYEPGFTERLLVFRSLVWSTSQVLKAELAALLHTLRPPTTQDLMTTLTNGTYTISSLVDEGTYYLHFGAAVARSPLRGGNYTGDESHHVSLISLLDKGSTIFTNDD
jgi:hypothetical protein